MREYPKPIPMISFLFSLLHSHMMYERTLSYRMNFHSIGIHIALFLSGFLLAPKSQFCRLYFPPRSLEIYTEKAVGKIAIHYLKDWRTAWNDFFDLSFYCPNFFPCTTFFSMLWKRGDKNNSKTIRQSSFSFALGHMPVEFYVRGTIVPIFLLNVLNLGQPLFT